MYWYSSNFVSLAPWSKVYASRTLSDLGLQTLKIDIIGHSHHIEFSQAQKQGFTEVLATKVPVSLQDSAVQFEIQENFYLEGEKWKLWTHPLEEPLIHKFIDSPDCLYHRFDTNRESWTSIQWKLSKNNSEVEFETLHSYPEYSLIIYSKSHYNLN